MYLAGRWAHRQLSRLELVTAAIVLCIILFVFIQYMLKVFALAERSLLTTTVVNINTALQYRAASYVLKGDFASLVDMQGTNPFNMGNIAPSRELPISAYLIAPSNYLGEMDAPDPSAVEGGSWYFDRIAGRLVYRVDNTEYFHGSLQGVPRVEYTVDFQFEDLDGNERFDPASDEYKSVRLKAVNEYEWHL